MAIRASHLLPHILSSLLLAHAGLHAHAAELGEARVLSHIGQQLVADVELTTVEDAGAKVEARLAHPDVYRGANIAMPAVLSSLNMSVMRQGGRQFLHLTSIKPVESRHLHVYLELQDGGQRTVRLVTLWLTPDPNPAPLPAVVPASAAASAPGVVPAVVPAAAWVAATGAQATRDLPRRDDPPRKAQAAARPAAALHEGEEYVEEGARPAPLAAPPRKAAAKSAAAPARPAPPRKLPATLASPGPLAAAPGACAPQPAPEHVNACAVLGEKNAVLRHQLGQLEAKVNLLQVAAGGAPSAAADTTPSTVPATTPSTAPSTSASTSPSTSASTSPSTATAPAAVPAPKGAPRILRAKKKPAPPEPETPWGLIAGGVAAVLALAALGLVLLRRRRRSGFGKIQKEHKPARLPKAAQEAEPAAPEGMLESAPKPSFMSSVKARLMPASRKNPTPEPAEPAVETPEP